jgi:NAD(P)-dependent dehydrogenase (short-subunit alcohol dehydrogenase family)
MSEMRRTVLVTGALAGIGRATAVAFAEAGANVVVSGRRPDAGEALAEQLRGHGGEIELVAADRVTGGDAQAKAAFLATIPQGRAGHPNEIADAILFVSSEQAGFLTGQTITIDGGMTAS